MDSILIVHSDKYFALQRIACEKTAHISSSVVFLLRSRFTTISASCYQYAVSLHHTLFSYHSLFFLHRIYCAMNTVHKVEIEYKHED